jgi:hypothetical protein
MSGLYQEFEVLMTYLLQSLTVVGALMGLILALHDAHRSRLEGEYWERKACQWARDDN